MTTSNFRLGVIQISLVALSLIGVSQLNAQTWTRQSPYPADVDLLDVHFITEDYGWISGHDDLLMFTADGGTTWQQTTSIQRSPQFHEDPIWDVEFVNDQLGFAFGNNMYRTTDGGVTWQDIGFLGSIYDMDWVNEQVGFAIGNLWIARTDDGGDSWNLIWNWEDFNAVTSVDFLDESTGWVTGQVDGVVGVFKTTDGGQTFNRLNNQALSNIRVLDANTLLATRYAEFYRSTDGGVTWSLQHVDNADLFGIAELTRIDVDSFAAIDAQARIWISDDAGVTWTRTQDHVNNSGSEWDIQFPTPQVGYAVGNLGLIFKSTDGGYSWTQISNGAAAAFDDIVMTTGGRGVAIGSAIVYTSDFGQTWTVAHDAPQDMITLQAIDQDTFYAAGSNRFFRSDDGGRTWQQISTTPRGVNDISFLNENEGWTCGPSTSGGHSFLRTTDGGQTWDMLRDVPNTRIPTGIQIMPSLRGCAIFPQTEQAITENGFDNSFIPRTMPGGDSWQWFEFANDNVGWYGGFYGGVLKSSNGGFIFDAQELPGFQFGGGGNDHRLRDVRVLDIDDAYIATIRPGAIYQGVIYRTIDGENWFELNPISDPTNQAAGSLGQIDVLPTGEIWATGGIGFIWSSGIPEVGELAELVELQVATGTALDGTIAELNASDDAYVHTRSGFGATFVDLHHMELIVSATTNVPAPTSLDLMIEERIDQPTGTAQIRLRNWSTGEFEMVGSYPIGSSDSAHALENVNASDYVDAAGAIEVSIKHIVFKPFLAFTFESFIDQVEIVVQ